MKKQKKNLSEKIFEFLVAEVMKSLNGKANPIIVRKLVAETLQKMLEQKLQQMQLENSND